MESKKKLRNKTAFLDMFASVETKFEQLEQNKPIQEQKLSVVSEQLFWLLIQHTFIFSSLDCNLRLLLTFHSSSANSKLIQNAAAFAPTKTYRCSLIIPVCGSLHWLPWFSGFMLNPSINYIQRSGYLPPPNVHRYFHHSWCVLLIWAVPHLL